MYQLISVLIGFLFCLIVGIVAKNKDLILASLLMPLAYFLAVFVLTL